jgi:hypothetical protein
LPSWDHILQLTIEMFPVSFRKLSRHRSSFSNFLASSEVGVVTTSWLWNPKASSDAIKGLGL